MERSPFLMQNKGIILVLITFFLLALVCFLTIPVQEAKAKESFKEEVFSFDKEDLSGVVQLWCVILDSREQITYYPMKKIGDKKYRVFLPKEMGNVHRWFYPSKRDLGEKVIRFDLTTAANSVFLMHIE